MKVVDKVISRLSDSSLNAGYAVFIIVFPGAEGSPGAAMADGFFVMNEQTAQTPNLKTDLAQCGVDRIHWLKADSQLIDFSSFQDSGSQA